MTIRPNHDAKPLELERSEQTANPGNILVRTSDGKPIYEVIDTQQGGGKGYPDGVIVTQATKESDSLLFVTARVLDGWLTLGEYRI